MGRRNFSLLASVLLLATAGAQESKADFAAGLTAYDAGDLETAVFEWRESAEAGDLDSIVALAGLYEQGTGVPLDPGEAARLYRSAAEKGHRVAQLNLGEMLATGRGVKRDRVEAYIWLALAAEQGSLWASQRLDTLARNMTVTQRLIAEKRLAAALGNP